MQNEGLQSVFDHTINPIHIFSTDLSLAQGVGETLLEMGI